MWLLSRLLKKIVRHGRLTVIDADGEEHLFHEEGCAELPDVIMRLHSHETARKLALNPEMHAGEAYMDGMLTFEGGSTVADFLTLFSMNAPNFKNVPFLSLLRKFWRMVKRFQQFNTLSRSRANVKHHYDMSNDMYRLFLDEDMQYSCAYFRSDNHTLEQAQEAKKAHIVAKLCLKPGMRVLDIGCGWGGMALYIARMVPDVQVMGITLSEEQLKLARQRAEEAGLSDRVTFKLCDYRAVEGCFDRIVSVGMFEHVGAFHFRDFFSHVSRLLAEDGVMLLHSIGRISPPGTTGPWLRKYIFPGGYAPALSEVFRAVEEEYFWVSDVEILRLHYAKTLQHWQQRFEANRDAVVDLLDERFCRMWEFYLSLAEHAFTHGTSQVFQMQLAKKRDSVPLTRDYIGEAEAGFEGSGQA